MDGMIDLTRCLFQVDHPNSSASRSQDVFVRGRRWGVPGAPSTVAKEKGGTERDPEGRAFPCRVSPWTVMVFSTSDASRSASFLRAKGATDESVLLANAKERDGVC